MTLMWAVSSVKGTNEMENLVIRGIAVMFLAITSLASPTWLYELDRHRTGFSFRLGFARPVSTLKLVAVPMIFAVMAATFCYVVPALLFGWMQGNTVPIFGPVLVVASLVIGFIAVTWSPTTVVGKVIGFMALAMVAVALVIVHFRQYDAEPVLMAMGRPEYYALAWYEYLALLLVVGVAFAVTLVAVERQRHGDTWNTGWFAKGTQVLVPAKVGTPCGQPFRSPFVAQCWYELRRQGPPVLTISVIAPLLLFVFACIVPLMDPKVDGAGYAWLVALLLCPFVYQLVGADGAVGLQRRQGAVFYSTFDGSRAMSNDHLIGTKLLVIGACAFVGWLLMVLAAAFHALLTGDEQTWLEIGSVLSKCMSDLPAYWWLVGASNALLLYISSTSVLLAFALWLPLHGRLFISLAVVGYLHVMLAIWDAEHGWTLWYLWTAYGYLAAVAIVAGCIFALWRAFVAGSLGGRLFAGAFCLWGIYVVSAISLYLRLAVDQAIPLAALVLGAALLLLPLATTALAPLALASHRHV
jgi:hypothetical protein